jgi:hypothetical protein
MQRWCGLPTNNKKRPEHCFRAFFCCLERVGPLSLPPELTRPHGPPITLQKASSTAPLLALDALNANLACTPRV